MKASSSLVIIVSLLAFLVFPLSSAAASQPQQGCVSGCSVASNSGFLDLSPAAAQVGMVVNVSGYVTEAPDQDQSCSISSPTNALVINNDNPRLGVACVINGGSSTTGNFTGSFTLGDAPPGQYVIEVTACPGNNGCSPSQGDWVQAILVVQNSPTIEVSPYGAFPGGTLQVFGSGFSLNDNSCTLAGDAVAAGGTISCQISDGQLTGLFVVANVPTGYYALTAIGNTGDFANTNVGVSGA